MSIHNWSALLQAQVESGLSIEAFCRERKVARSNFYAARARQTKRVASNTPSLASGVVPIQVVDEVAAPQDIAITVVVASRTFCLRGSASDLAQLLHCL